MWEYKNYIERLCKVMNLPLDIVVAMIITESSGNIKAHRVELAFYKRYIQDKLPWTSMEWYDDPNRISASYGLLQVMYTTAYGHGFRGKPEDLFDPHLSLLFGCLEYKAKLDKYNGEPINAVAAYNAGSVRFKSDGKYENQWHVDKVLKNRNLVDKFLTTGKLI